MIHRPKICVDKHVPPSLAAPAAIKETEENRPLVIPGTPLGNTVKDGRQSAFILTGKKWETGRTIRVAFLGGTQKVIDRVISHANEWTKYANIKFEWGASPAVSDVRMSFDKASGSWSYLGVDALTIPRDEATMNFGWLEPDTADTEYSRVVKHEFGHMLGMPHEHQSPKSNIPWDKDAVYKYYMGPPNNWSKEDVDYNLFAKYSESNTNFSEFDPKSVMMYAIPNDLTVGDYQVGWNTDLSDKDKSFVAWQYPMPDAPPPVLDQVSVTTLARYPGRYFGKNFQIFTQARPGAPRVARWDADAVGE